ncbi:MAG: hypothetical protein V3U03_07275, partial [Myxococcota bacterium]
MSNSDDGNLGPIPETLEMTKREATLLVHVGEHFPTGFCEHELAASLAWSVDEVREALVVCAAFDLVSTPPGVDVPVAEPVDGSPLVGIDDLLDPEEQEEACVSHCPRREPRCPLPDADFWLTPEEQAAIGQALT